MEARNGILNASMYTAQYIILLKANAKKNGTDMVFGNSCNRRVVSEFHKGAIQSR